MTELQMWTCYLRAVTATLLARDRDRDERGISTAETVLLTAVFAAAAITIGGIIVAKFTGKANSIPTGP